MSILHIVEPQTFTEPFFRFIEKKFSADQHSILSLGLANEWPNDLNVENVTSSNLRWLIDFSLKANRAEKIVLHGLFQSQLVIALSFQPWLLKKCYWVMWGGDLYHYCNRSRGIKSNVFEFFRSFVIKHLGHFVTYIKGDYELARKWYGATGQYHECLMYLSNIYKGYVVPPKQGTEVNILVGNSATPSNNHFDVFEKLAAYEKENIVIYCPLSYGEPDYAQQVMRKGKELFGDKFIPLMKFMPFEEYQKLLGQIDIAVFSHRRQQGMGNTITLLGLGKKVYMRNDVTQWQLFEEIGVNVFDVNNLSLDPLDDLSREKNKIRITNVFSEKNIVNQYSKIFG